MIQTSISQSPWNRTALGSNSERIRLLFHDELSGEECWEELENLRESTLDDEGQFISLDLTELQAPLPEVFCAALKNASWERSLPFSLPVMLQHNRHSASPFINRAILWQRLCDLLIMDDEPYRETILVLENVDLASPTIQHDIARLIRFHETHSLCRTFVFTLSHYSHSQIISELRDILDI